MTTLFMDLFAILLTIASAVADVNKTTHHDPYLDANACALAGILGYDCYKQDVFQWIQQSTNIYDIEHKLQKIWLCYPMGFWTPQQVEMIYQAICEQTINIDIHSIFDVLFIIWNHNIPHNQINTAMYFEIIHESFLKLENGMHKIKIADYWWMCEDLLLITLRRNRLDNIHKVQQQFDYMQNVIKHDTAIGDLKWNQALKSMHLLLLIELYYDRPETLIWKIVELEMMGLRFIELNVDERLNLNFYNGLEIKWILRYAINKAVEMEQGLKIMCSAFNNVKVILNELQLNNDYLGGVLSLTRRECQYIALEMETNRFEGISLEMTWKILSRIAPSLITEY